MFQPSLQGPLRKVWENTSDLLRRCSACPEPHGHLDRLQFLLF